MQFQLLIYAFIIFLLAGCREKNDPRLDLWEQQMSIAPDSILTLLETTEVSSLSTDYDRARYPLLLMMARDKCYLPLQPDTALKEATDYFHKTKDLLNETKARYYSGLAERHVGNNQQAIWETLNAIDRAHEAADTFWMGRTHDLAYEIYMQTYDCRNAAIEADIAAVYFKRAGAEQFHRYALLEKAQALNLPVYEDGTPVGEGMPLLDSLKNVALLDNDSSLIASCLSDKCINSFEKKDYITMENIIDSIRMFSKDSIFINRLIPNIISMQIARGQLPEILLKAYKKNLKTQQDTISYLRTRSEFEVANHNWKAAFLLSDSLLSYYNLIMADKTFKSIDESKDKYNKLIIDNKKKENTQLKSIQILIICFAAGIILIAVCSILLIYIRNNYKKKKTMEQLLEIASENEILKIQVDIQRDIEIENKVLKEKLQSQKESLAAYEKLVIKLKDYDQILSENLSLKEKLVIQKKENEHAIQVSDSSLTLSLKRSSLLGNRIDALCNLAMEYYGSQHNPVYKNEIYHRAFKELSQLKSEKFLKDFERKVNEIHNNIIVRFQQQLPEVAKGNTTWFAMFIGGLQPRTISFLLDMKIQTLYSKRLRVRSYIEKSTAPDKKEFLLFFPKLKDS